MVAINLHCQIEKKHVESSQMKLNELKQIRRKYDTIQAIENLFWDNAISTEHSNVL